MKDIFIVVVFITVLAAIEIIILNYVSPRIVAKNREDRNISYYSTIDNPRNFKFECFWDFSTSLFPSRICTYEPIKKD